MKISESPKLPSLVYLRLGGEIGKTRKKTEDK